MRYYPIFLNLTGKRVLVVGAGRIALRKLQGLIGSGAEITVVSPTVLPEIQALPGVIIIKRLFRLQDMLNVNIVYAATDDFQVNHAIGDNIQSWQWFNNTSCSKESNFYSPAIIKRGDLIIGISTRNLNPVNAKKYKRKILSFLESVDSSIKRDTPFLP